MPAEPEVVVFFDGVCNFCNSAVRWLIERDSTGNIRYASLQSTYAERALGNRGISRELLSVVLLEGDRVYQRSTAALRLVRRLRFPWPLLFGLILVPRPARDFMYDQFARRRYAWFGKSDVCSIPSQEIRKRFLDQ